MGEPLGSDSGITPPMGELGEEDIVSTLEKLTSDQAHALELVFDGLGQLFERKSTGERGATHFFHGIGDEESKEFYEGRREAFGEAAAISRLVGNAFSSGSVRLHADILIEGADMGDNIAETTDSPVLLNSASTNLELIRSGTELPAITIANTLGVSPESLRLWNNGAAIRQKNQGKVADFAAIVHFLQIKHELAPAEVKQFLESKPSDLEGSAYSNVLDLLKQGKGATVLKLAVKQFGLL